MPVRKEGDCIERTLVASGCGLAFGSFLGMTQYSWNAPPAPKAGLANVLEAGKIAPQSYFTHLTSLMGSGAAYFAVAGAAFAAGDCIAESLRGNKRDMWNGVVGGACAGAVLGFATKSAPKMVATSAGMALAIGIFEAVDFQLFSNRERIEAKRSGLAKSS
mmetsp:Transcript_2738/g.3900  ORF Transcript_2738/g.3900 Transcript_2738/m.3900 type:complete len:161 (-) Transcript_2738:311-793(-)|eukprot:CAMPEP_0117759314 /NCGR_PEP_ID=MMETSP0947-20121206/15941_1 /TAXON_ID=44440 /ORGANISM="Chattonella subsalsa, Strain CCMP2191" /LENGTH=160 /DNA_ID=CAMNT_0005579751 /DNA_START=89 /DNA_END=571 /DNA_ORIENTATION=-